MDGHKNISTGTKEGFAASPFSQILVVVFLRACLSNKEVYCNYKVDDECSVTNTTTPV